MVEAASGRSIKTPFWGVLAVALLVTVHGFTGSVHRFPSRNFVPGASLSARSASSRPAGGRTRGVLRSSTPDEGAGPEESDGAPSDAAVVESAPEVASEVTGGDSVGVGDGVGDGGSGGDGRASEASSVSTVRNGFSRVSGGVKQGIDRIAAVAA